MLKSLPENEYAEQLEDALVMTLPLGHHLRLGGPNIPRNIFPIIVIVLPFRNFPTECLTKIKWIHNKITCIPGDRFPTCFNLFFFQPLSQPKTPYYSVKNRRP